MVKRSDFSNDEHRTNIVDDAIIRQLRVAAPASLPVDFIVSGVLCVCDDFENAGIVGELNRLCSAGTIIKISEGGLCDRYRLAVSTDRSSEREAGC